MSGEDADVETASEGYASRFAGPVGAWFLQRQARTTLDLLSPWPGARVLEVGGGHGQVTADLLDAGYAVTIYASGPEALASRVRPLVNEGRVAFRSGDLLRAPWPDASFDVVLALRLLPHVHRWRELVTELVRLAARAVIVDYPSRRSVNLVSGLLFGVKRRVERNTRPFTVFRDAELAAAFASSRASVTARRPQFFFPMALHRALRQPRLSRAIEGLAAACGLRRGLGSPVLLRCERG